MGRVWINSDRITKRFVTMALLKIQQRELCPKYCVPRLDNNSKTEAIINPRFTPSDINNYQAAIDVAVWNCQGPRNPDQPLSVAKTTIART